jgi:hypothetical protein
MFVVAASRAQTSFSANDSGGRVISAALITLAVTYRCVPRSRLGMPSGRNRRCFASTNLSTTAHSINPTRAQYRRNSTIAVMCAFTVFPVRGFPARVAPASSPRLYRISCGSEIFDHATPCE